jgi:plasmid stabilization system protein ParE
LRISKRSVTSSAGIRRSTQLTVVERIIAAVNILERFPHAGRTVPEYSRPDVRELVRPPYRIVYRVYNDGVDIATVFRSSQLIPDLR